VNLRHRLQKIEATLPQRDSRVMYLAGPDHVPSEADRCPHCGGCHVLVIHEEVVAVHPAD